MIFPLIKIKTNLYLEKAIGCALILARIMILSLNVTDEIFTGVFNKT